ncbi:MAG: hypothetical protein HYV33_00105 [Candidatus Kerfeldbacteria bacterium]|nr:hypothetical protein [Candidatus Kerfeldbacteria bacterium]
MIKIFVTIAAMMIPWAAQADVVFPTETTIYFENQTKPITQPVDFIIRCYGYQYAPGVDPGYAPGSYMATEVYSLTAACPSYGCSINEPYYLNYLHIDYCSITAQTPKKTLTINNIGNKPYSQCDFQSIVFDSWSAVGANVS